MQKKWVNLTVSGKTCQMHLWRQLCKEKTVPSFIPLYINFTKDHPLYMWQGKGVSLFRGQWVGDMWCPQGLCDPQHPAAALPSLMPHEASGLLFCILLEKWRPRLNWWKAIEFNFPALCKHWCLNGKLLPKWHWRFQYFGTEPAQRTNK